MILAFCLLTLLVATNAGAQRIKGGGHRIIQAPAFLGGGGGLGASSAQFSVDDAQIPSFGQRRLYRVGQSQVPFGLSGLDYYSYPASLLTRRRNLGGKNIFADNVSGLSPIGYGGRKSAIIADPSTSQFTVGDSQIRSFGGRNLYRTGLSAVPYGLSGLDYYSYPRSLLTQRRGLGSGLGQTKILSGGGFTAGDSQISGLLNDPIGQEQVTIVESSPAGLIQTAQEPVTTIIEDGGFGQRQITTVTKSAGGLGGGLRGGQILLRGGPGLGVRRVKTRPVIQAAAPVQDVQVLVDATSGLGAPIGGFGQRQVAVTKSVAAPVIQAPIIAAQAPVRRVINRGLGEAFITQAVRPRLAARRIVARPQFVSQPRVVDQGYHSGPGNIQFTLGNTQIIGGPISAQAPVVSYQRPVVAVQRPTYVQRPVVAVQRPVVSYQRPVVAVQRPVVAVQPVQQVVSVKQPQVISQVKTSGGFGGRRIFGRQIPQLVYNDGGSRFLGYDSFGGYRIGDPRYNYAQLPISTRRFANLGLSQGSIDAGPVLLAPAAAPSFLSTKSSGLGSGGLGIAGIGKTSPVQVVTQEEVIGPAGDSQIITTVQNAGPSKIGGAVLGGGLAGIGQTGATKTITQEEVIGPAGDSQIVTTVTQSGPSKIGGPVLGGGLAGIGQTGATKTITQEEVIGPSGDSQILTTVTQSGPSKIGGLASGGPLGLSGIGQTGGTKTITQEEVIGPAGDSQIVTTVTKSGPSKIGGPVVGGLGLSGIGHTSPAKVVTQEEVIGPAGDSQIVTTITESGGPSKIGGVASGSPFGFSGVGQAQQKVITQEEVIGPAGDSQIITTVSETSPQNIVQQEDIGSTGFSSLGGSPLSQIVQDPIESALSQESLGDNVIVSSGSSLLSPFGTGQTQLLDDVIGQSDISGGAGLSELSQQAIGGGGFSDPIVQQSISPGFGNAFGFSPRVSFLSQYPYDVPSRALLRQAVTRPFIQDQQQLEQILVK